MLGGILGLGLKRNVLHLYRFVCRNYNSGDTIHAFGFSRGAFTIRLLVALICTQGIAAYRDERELGYNSADAFYRFIDANAPDKFRWFWLVARSVREGVRLGWRRMSKRLIDVPPAHRPDVDFVGVWDTVAAYGGPISEITRGIDKYVWPLTMTNFELNPKVKAARHALALDEERDSFSPLLWDEVNEARLASEAETPELRERFRTRLKQLWFAGVHSDVGGGYPDDSLSYVSLVWMIDEIGGTLRFIADEERHIRAFANALGPIHDSRKGLGSYYRYQPRKIAALLHRGIPDTLAFDETLAFRDPTISEKRDPPQGLLLSCRVHDSVIDRIGAGTDNYAPIGLPRDIVVVSSGVTPDATGATGAAIAQLTTPRVAAARGEAQENAWDDVWRRRVGYFVVVALTLVLVASPLYATRPDRLLGTDSRWVVDIVIGWFAPIVPGFAHPWFQAFRLAWPTFLGVGLAIWLVSARMKAQEQRLGDAVRIAWWDAIEGRAPHPASATRLRRWRNGRAYQRSLQTLKWRILPFLFGWSMLLAMILYLPAIIGTQLWLTRAEAGGTFCRSAAAGAAIDAAVTFRFRADDPCAASGASVTEGRRYRLVIAPDPAAGSIGWTDGGIPVPWGGQRSWSFPWGHKGVMLLGAPFRRVVPAGWLEPLVEVRGDAGRSASGHARSRIAIQRLTVLQPPRRDTRPIFVGEFAAPFDGSLHLFLNDAVGPFLGSRYFYAGGARTRNGGRALICVEDVERSAIGRGQGCGTAGWSPPDGSDAP